MQDIVGNEVIDEFQRNNMADYCDLFREFEVKKRKISSLDERIILKVPVMLSEIFQAKHSKTIKDHLATKLKYKNNIHWEKDKLRIGPEVARTLFEEACVSAANHLKSLFENREVKDVPTILMVGGFSESPVLQDVVKKALPGKKVIVPSDPGLVVLKGAVMYGHDPSVIQERRCRYTYGADRCLPFKEGVDPEDKKIVADDGEVLCEDRFDAHVRIGEVVPSGRSTVTKTLRVVYTDQEKFTFKLFASDKKEPYFVTDTGCLKIGDISVDVPGSGLDRSATLCFIFGDTEIHAEVIEGQSGKKTKATFKFLG